MASQHKNNQIQQPQHRLDSIPKSNATPILKQPDATPADSLRLNEQKAQNKLFFNP